jgi:hypothetical protein
VEGESTGSIGYAAEANCVQLHYRLVESETLVNIRVGVLRSLPLRRHTSVLGLPALLPAL